MRILVCGSRSFDKPDLIWDMLNGIEARWLKANADRRWNDMSDPLLLIEGGAKGADKIASMWITQKRIPVANRDHYLHASYPAEWEEHSDGWCPGGWCSQRNYCVGAGPRRNQQMLEVGRPDRVLAFFDKPYKESRGTRDMCERAEAAGVRVTKIVEF